jgi:hypothetical protein
MSHSAIYNRNPYNVGFCFANLLNKINGLDGLARGLTSAAMSHASNANLPMPLS